MTFLWWVSYFLTFYKKWEAKENCQGRCPRSQKRRQTRTWDLRSGPRFGKSGNTDLWIPFLVCQNYLQLNTIKGINLKGGSKRSQSICVPWEKKTKVPRFLRSEMHRNGVLGMCQGRGKDKREGRWHSEGDRKGRWESECHGPCWENCQTKEAIQIQAIQPRRSHSYNIPKEVNTKKIQTTQEKMYVLFHPQQTGITHTRSQPAHVHKEWIRKEVRSVDSAATGENPDLATTGTVTLDKLLKLLVPCPSSAKWQ